LDQAQSNRYFICRKVFVVSSLVLTLTETLRYRGAIGQWSWVLHRVTGLGVVLFLVLHVIDTSWAVFYPHLYEEAIAAYQSPLFTIGEFFLVACVVYHAYNGLRIAIFDLRPHLWRIQEKAAYAVIGLTVLTLIPVFVLMFAHVLDFYGSDEPILALDKVLKAQIPFAIGIVLAIVAAVIFSGIAGLIAGGETKPSGRGSKVERFWWSYMRLSGLLIVPLVFGHLAMMHIVQGVFDLTAANHTVVGTGLINESGTAVEFVQARWSLLGWKIYDIGLLALVVLHGFNGLRYVLTDYTMHNPLMRRAATYLTIIGAVVLLVVGAGALLGSIEQEAVERAREAQIELGLVAEGDAAEEIDRAAEDAETEEEDAEAEATEEG
jgi:succinate dehydrogenase / fumarate reductase, cytochrome b subunit